MRRRAAIVPCAVLLFTALSCGGDTGPDPDGSDPRILWTFLADAETYYGSPALSHDEQTVYLGTSTGSLGAPETTNAFYALSVATGDVRWELPLGVNEVRSTPAIGPDGSITFVAEERTPSGAGVVHDLLYRLSSSGEILWTYDINPSGLGVIQVGQSAPTIASDGTVYVAAGALYAIRSDGTLKWTRFAGTTEDLRNAPVIGADGTLYFVYHNIPLTALDPSDGHTLWALDLGLNDHVLASPAIGADGTIYVATQPGVVYAVSSSGALLWTFETSSIGYSCTLRSSPAIDADGTLYFGTNSGSPSSIFLALNPNGTFKWAFEPADLPPDVPSTHFDIYSSPTIGSDGTIYFGQEFGRVYALDPADAAIRWMVETQSGITWSSPTLSDPGTLFITDLSGRTYAIETASRGLKSQAPWPKFRHDNRNSGSMAP
jgi:outer membrane protein assembly factor BamB